MEPPGQGGWSPYDTVCTFAKKRIWWVFRAWWGRRRASEHEQELVGAGLGVFLSAKADPV
jgi:hypothetical protein